MANCVKRILGRIIRNESEKPKSPMWLIRKVCVQTEEVGKRQEPAGCGDQLYKMS